MKRLGAVYGKFCSLDNISKALTNASKGKKEYREVKKILNNKDFYINKIHDLLINKNFINSKYKTFIRESGGKERVIKKLPFYPDRVIQHCIVQVAQDVWVKTLIRDTYSTIPGRGIHDGVNRVKKALKDKENTKFCLKFDINKYYPSIDNTILKKIIRKKIKDNDFLNVLDNIIDSEQGIPIGNYVSQWFGNLYLSELDHYIKEQLKCKYYFRYCDDLVLLSNNKNVLWSWFDNIKDFLENKLNLVIKNNYQVFPLNVRGLDFLGYRFFHDYTLVRKRIVKTMKQKLNNPKSMASYYGWLKHADTFRLRDKYKIKYN